MARGRDTVAYLILSLSFLITGHATAYLIVHTLTKARWALYTTTT